MIMKKDNLNKIFESLTKKEQNAIIEFLLFKASTKLCVFNFKAEKIMVTNNFQNAFNTAFLEGNRGYFESNTNLNFCKVSPSMITNTIETLFNSLVEYLNFTPNVIYKQLLQQKLIKE